VPLLLEKLYSGFQLKLLVSALLTPPQENQTLSEFFQDYSQVKYDDRAGRASQVLASGQEEGLYISGANPGGIDCMHTHGHHCFSLGCISYMGDHSQSSPHSEKVFHQF